MNLRFELMLAFTLNSRQTYDFGEHFARRSGYITIYKLTVFSKQGESQLVTPSVQST